MAKMDFLAFVKLSSQECLLHSNVIHFNVLLSSPSLPPPFSLHLFIAKVKGNNCTFRSNSRNCFCCKYIAYFQADLKRNFYCTFRTIYMTKLKTIYKLNYFKIAYLLILRLKSTGKKQQNMVISHTIVSFIPASM